MNPIWSTSFIINSVFALTNVQDTSNHVLSVYQISEISVTLGCSNLPPAQLPLCKVNDTTNIVSSLQEYGCWCGKLFGGRFFGGEPLDELDKICKAWSKCNRCVSKEPECTGNKAEDGSYEILNLGVNSHVYECAGDSKCSGLRCECNTNFSILLARYFIENGSFLKGCNFGHQDQCKKVEKVGDGCVEEEEKPCCGESPNWAPYCSERFQCDAGILVQK